MSISYFVYSPNEQVVSRRALADRLQAKGWFVTFVDPRDVTKALPEGMVDDDLVVGTRSPEEAERVNQLILSGDRVALDELYAEGACASSGLGITHPYVFEEIVPESDVEELIAQIGPEAVDEMRRAVVEYETYTSAGRLPPSLQLQEDAWEAVGELASGLLEDPETGSYRLCRDGQMRDLEVPERQSPLPPELEMLGRFLDEARRRGFPVSGDGLKASFAVDELSRERMEEALILVGEILPDLHASALRATLLEDYVWSQGPRFKAENADWIDRMKSGEITRDKGSTGRPGILQRLWNWLVH